jgi:hypothetical protein
MPDNPPVSDMNLAQILRKHPTELHGLSKSLMDGKPEEFSQQMVDFLVSLTTSGVPMLDVLAKEGVARVFANSSNAELRREIERLEQEEERQRFVEDVATPIAELIGQALIQLVRTQQRAADEVVAALGGLQEEFEAFRADFGKQIMQTSVEVDQIRVTKKGVGIRITPRPASNVKVNTIDVTDEGTGLVV